MHWRIKAAVQNAISLLPEETSYEVYYRLQKRFGNLKKSDPIDRLKAGIEIWDLVRKAGFNPVDKVFLEIGTGRSPVVPLALWMMGAGKIITIDVNPYIKEEIVREHVRYLSENSLKIRTLFGNRIVQGRLEAVRSLYEKDFTLREFFDLCCIEYRAPEDAGRTDLPPGSVDFHTSYAVLEHIPTATLKAILLEGNRLTRSGLFVHRIDYSDHFAHDDRSISKINFLKYSDARWKWYAGNKYMFMNRLRHDDYVEMLQGAGHRVLSMETDLDQDIADMVSKGSIALDERFRGKTTAVLATTGAWIVSRYQGSHK